MRVLCSTVHKNGAWTLNVWLCCCFRFFLGYVSSLMEGPKSCLLRESAWVCGVSG